MGEPSIRSVPEAGDFVTTSAPYTLVIPIPCHVDPSGGVWLDRGWNHDLLQHLSYLKDFVLCAPRLPLGSEPNLVRFVPPKDARISFAFLPAQNSYLRAWLNLPRTALAIWRAIGRSSIVHSGPNGWPYPLGWIAIPMAVLRRKRIVVVVESDWKYNVAGRESLKYRLLDMDPIRFRMARWCCNHADLALFTQAGYRDQLRTRDRGGSYVTPAVWVNQADILARATAEASWDEKLRQPVRLLHAGRLLLAKGVGIILASLRLLEQRGEALDIDIIGTGEQLESCVNAARELRHVRLRILEPVPYGQAFFELVRGYHAVLVPSLTNEQPRIVFDANSQAVPVIASDTDGLRPHVEHERTGWLVRSGDVEALAAALVRARESASELRSLGLNALAATRGVTHQAMHLQRSHLIARHCS